MEVEKHDNALHLYDYLISADIVFQRLTSKFSKVNYIRILKSREFNRNAHIYEYEFLEYLKSILSNEHHQEILIVFNKPNRKERIHNLNLL